MKSQYHNFLTCLLVVIVGMTACRTSRKVSQRTKKSLEAQSPLATIFDTSKVFTANITGFALYDPVADSMLYGQNEDRYFTPASNTKLYTFYTGLTVLPDSIRALEYVVKGDSLIFWGTGDPSFLHPEMGNRKVYNFLKSRDEKLYFSDSNFDNDLLGPGWAWDDYNYSYQAERTPLPMYGNMIRFQVQDIKLHQLASTKKGFAVSPEYFRPSVDKAEQESTETSMLRRAINSNEITYRPEADTLTHTEEKPYHYTPQVITGMLADTLHQPVEYLSDMPKPDTTKVIYSIAADTAYKHMLQPSDNFIAEQLLMVSASEMGIPLNSPAVIKKMKSQHLNMLPGDPQWNDGSGLSRYNLFTPRMMVRLLQAIDKKFTDDQQLFDLLPTGGEAGTIKHWYAAHDDGDPYVFAKTGTLSNNHCLSGYLITASGRKLIFSFMNNHYVMPTSTVKEEIDKVLWYIHQHY